MAEADKGGPPPQAVLGQMINGYWLSFSIIGAAQLGIADALDGDAPTPVARIAERTGGNGDAIYRVMRALASVGIFREEGARAFVQRAEDVLEAKELTGGAGVDQVIEVGGAGTLQQSLQALRFGGTVSLIGNLAGTKAEILLTHIFMQSIRVQGILVGDRESFEAMNRAIALHGLKPVIDRTFPLAQTADALKVLAGRKAMGKVILHP